MTAVFQSVEDKHCAYCDKAEQRQSVHNIPPQPEMGD
jgi:hypothetical protein